MSEEVKSKKSRQGATPRKEADIITVAANIAASWKNRPGLILAWTTPDSLTDAAGIFKTSVTVRNETKGDRAVITRTLQSINTEVDQSVRYVKGYIADMFQAKEAPVYYGQFGIAKERGRFKMPDDNDKRQLALEQMVKAIDRHGMGDRKYGNPYWTNIYEQFVQAKSRASDSDSSSAEHVSIKTEQKALIRKTLNALIHLIKANYPDTWKEEMRIWGFQKEKY
ncbi:MAG: hypothetical protein LBL24_10290 [Bacteroidales bacterium]|jgi:hypothetical protein|nr:hypothetical protein [Bacteroidales bacterium]